MKKVCFLGSQNFLNLDHKGGCFASTEDTCEEIGVDIVFKKCANATKIESIVV